MTRFWTSHQDESGAVHALGNGEFLVYETGPVISALIGPPYTSPSFGSIAPAEGQALSCITEREPGTNIWHHRLTGDCGLAEWTDYLLPAQNAFVREYHCEQPVDLILQPGNGVELYRTDSGCLLRLPMGTNFFTGIAVERERWLCIEGATVQENGTLQLAGDGVLYITAGLLPEAMETLHAVRGTCPQDAVRAANRALLNRVTDLGAMLPDTMPAELRKAASDACESVALLITAQQSKSGGVQAGSFYPLAYVRDMAGTMRGLLALGLYPEARQIVEFWYSRFCLYGNVRNAEGMGHLGGRLYFPNDEVEVPAYILLSAFWYSEVTGDTALLEQTAAMLDWAFSVQLPHLGGWMTGFSGDETYIAGNVLSRVHTFDGSAESTLLFLESGRRYLAWCAENQRLSSEKLAEYTEILDQTKAHYRENFLIDGLLYCNNPARLQFLPKPPFVEGFCEVHDQLHHELRLGWQQYDPQSGYYCCADCFGKPQPQPFDRNQRYLLSSASLLPAFYESTLFSEDEKAAFASPYVRLFEQNGFVPSDANGRRSLGYDYGMFLYAMAEQQSDLREPALAAMLSVLDETGAWVEYYDDGKPFNCRCRPWESGINIAALRRCVESYI